MHTLNKDMFCNALMLVMQINPTGKLDRLHDCPAAGSHVRHLYSTFVFVKYCL